MTPERFETLAEAFGGDVARWPDADREAAATLMAADPAWAERVLAHAGALDAALAAFRPPRPSAEAMDRILAAAPRPRPARRWRAWILPAGMGAGLAAACAAGVVLGARMATPAALPPGSDAMAAAAGDDETLSYFDEDA